MSRRLTILAVLFVSSACDPCSGVVGCVVSPHTGVSGRVLDEATGIPAAGIPVDFVRTGGVALEIDSLRTTTDADGLFEFDIPAQAAGVATGYIRLRPANAAAYRVMGLTFPTSNRRGEARTVGPWSTVPHVPDLVQIFVRGAPPMNAGSTLIEFRQTSGVEVEGVTGTVYSRVTDPAGLVPLFRDQQRAVDAGDVIGDLTVFLPAPFGAIVRKDVHISSTPMFRPGTPVKRLGVGPTLEYHIAVFRRGRPAGAVEGAQVAFHRTGGIDIVPPDWASTTNEFGRVAFPVRPVGAGVLIGDVTITPPAPWKSFQRKGLSFPTFEADSAILYDIVEVGPGVSAYALFRANGKPIKGVGVDFRYTGGIAVNPRTFNTVSSDNGFALLTTATEAEGEVTADLTVRPPAPYKSFVVRGVRLQAFDGDRPASPIIVGTWDVATPPASIQHP